MYTPTSSVGVRINREQPPSRLIELAKQAEDAGLDEVWLVEDCFWAAGIATVATALAVTSTIKVGIGVLPAVARNPAIAAMELAALAELHPDRLIAGFGHGVASWMRQIGAYPESPLAALEETLGRLDTPLDRAKLNVLIGYLMHDLVWSALLVLQ